jgi:hypothetical protein
MRTSAFPLRLALFTAASLSPSAILAAPAGPEASAAAVSPLEKARKALDAPVTMKLERRPLTEALSLWREKTGLTLVVDDLAIQQELGWSATQAPTPVNVDLDGVKARAALQSILTPYGLSFAVICDRVVVTTEDSAEARQMAQKINVDLDKVEFGDALKRLSRETGVSLVLDGRLAKEAKAPVSMQLEDVPLETAVRLLAETAGLKPVRMGNALFVTAKGTANELRSEPSLTPTVLPGGVELDDLSGAQIQIQRRLWRRRVGEWKFQQAGVGGGAALNVTFSN